MSTVRPGRVGSTTASPGRSTPGSDRSRSRAVATMPPVDPADTTAAASPRRTSWHATATLDRGRRRLASAPSSMARLSSAGTIWISLDGAHPAEHLAQPGRGPGQQDPDAVLALGRERPGHDLVGGVIPAHGVDRDHRAGAARPGGAPSAGRPGPVRVPGRPGPAAGSRPRDLRRAPASASPSRAGDRRSGPSGAALSGSPGCAAADGASSLLCPSTLSAGVVAPLWP